MTSESDPRVFFAAERTMLAWLRTGIAAIGLGFLVARFGYFLRLVQGHGGGSSQLSTGIGVGLVLIGALMIAASAWQHVRFTKTLTTSEIPHRYSTRLSLTFSALMAVLGILLALYLARTTDFSHPTGDSMPAAELAPA